MFYKKSSILYFSLVFVFLVFSVFGIYQTKLGTEIVDLRLHDNNYLDQQKHEKMGKLDEETIKNIRADVSNLRDRHSALPYLTDGYLIANKKNHPELHLVIEKICEKLKMTKPLVLIYVGNKVNDFIAKLTGGFFCSSKVSAMANGVALPKVVLPKRDDGKNTTLGVVVLGLDFIENMNKKELEATIAHELSHLKHNHITKRTAWNMILLSEIVGSILGLTGNSAFIKGKFFYSLASKNIGSDVCNFNLFDSMSLKVQNFLLSLVSFGLVQKINSCKCSADVCADVNLLTFFAPGALTFLTQYFWRSNEKEADLSAEDVVDNLGQMQDGLKKIYDITYDKHKLLYYYMRLQELPILRWLNTHPTLDQRIEYLDEFDKKDK